MLSITQVFLVMYIRNSIQAISGKKSLHLPRQMQGHQSEAEQFPESLLRRSSSMLFLSVAYIIPLRGKTTLNVPSLPLLLLTLRQMFMGQPRDEK
jgi:hypothetical protein